MRAFKFSYVHEQCISCILWFCDTKWLLTVKYSTFLLTVLLLILVVNNTSYIGNHKQGNPLKSGEKTMLWNVCHKFCEKHQILTLEKIVNLSSEFSGMCKATIYIMQETKCSALEKKWKHTRIVLNKTGDELVRSPYTL